MTVSIVEEVKVYPTERSVGLQVVLFGGALFVVLAYTLSTELFSRNSPTVLLNEAIDMVEDSEVVSMTPASPDLYAAHQS